MGRICWRSDGEYFVYHFIDQSSQSRKFQVFTRDGLLHSTIEKHINILDSAIAWKYSKSLIAASIHRFDKHDIIFFEKNGLAHGGFTLPFPMAQMKVKNLLWNIDSTVLCVWLEVNSDDLKVATQSVVQLWTMANYHWYLKQSYNFKLDNKITTVSWDSEDSYSLHLFTLSGQYIKYKLGWTVNLCTPLVPNYNGSIGVSDGQHLLITPFKNKIIPSPMSLYRLNCLLPINHIVWSQFNMNLLVILMNGELIFYKHFQERTSENNTIKYNYEIDARASYDLKELKNYESSVQHVIWTNDNELVLIADTINGFKLLTCEIVRNDSKWAVIKKNEIDLESSILNVFYENNQVLGLQTIDGTILKYEKGLKNEWNLLNDTTKFLQPCSTFALVSVTCTTKHQQKYICIGLTQFYRLYADQVEIANNCSSFQIHDEYLIFTDHSNTIKFIKLSKLALSIDNNNNNTSKVQVESFRSVERGARLVNSIRSDTCCILQMPRGNIEAIHPRTLIISKLKKNIDNQKYLEAIQTMRKHRVNMNIIYDHNPNNFLKNITEFVQQIDDTYLINLFITELSHENTTKTYFIDHYAEENPKMEEEVDLDLSSDNDTDLDPVDLNTKKTEVISAKIQAVCYSLINICKNIDRKKFFLVILSCFAKMKRLDDALTEVIQLSNGDQMVIDEGLRHLLYIVNVNELFDVALGTYDFNIVLMVAEKSQKDPKEYLPFLNELKKLEENYRKYKIDVYLKRYKKALKSIVKCDETFNSEIINLVDTQKLYSEALKYYKPNDELYKSISKLFADHLNTKKYYDEAGIILTRAQFYQEALDSFLKSLNYQMYINVCFKLKLSPSLLTQKLTLLIGKKSKFNF
jgi:elongator complex protein 1